MDAGDRVDDFTATTDRGETITLEELLADGPVVVFFYPKAFTGGCTAEACHFRDLGAEFADAGATRVGVSRDPVAVQRRFATEHEFDYPLLADPDGELSELFDTRRMGPLWSKRHTFVIDTDRTVLKVIRSESDMETHADEALAVLRQH